MPTTPPAAGVVSFGEECCADGGDVVFVAKCLVVTRKEHLPHLGRRFNKAPSGQQCQGQNTVGKICCDASRQSITKCMTYEVKVLNCHVVNPMDRVESKIMKIRATRKLRSGIYCNWVK